MTEIPASVFRKRISRIKKAFENNAGESALLLGSAPMVLRNTDDFYNFKQNNDFLYLSGCNLKNVCLLITSKSSKPFLFATKPTAHQILWDGTPPNPAKTAQTIGAELILSGEQKKEILERLKGIDLLYYQNQPDSAAWAIAKQIINTPPSFRGSLPRQFAHAQVLLEGMRLHKDACEILMIKNAAALTNNALLSCLPLIMPGMREAELSQAVDYTMRVQGGEVAFGTISAAGPSAATLHYEAQSRVTKRGEMLLLDWGASYQGYAADISRTIPVDGEFSPLHKEIYCAVLEAQAAALKKIKHGAIIKSVYDAAAKVLTQGLVDIGVLRGKASSHFAKGSYKSYFPHGIGHPLGLDVHDVGSLRGNNEAKLEAGMVFTVEPGLYFPKKVGKVTPCGVRIEDDVHVTKNGCEILSAGFPKEPDEIEELMAQAKSDQWEA